MTKDNSIPGHLMGPVIPSPGTAQLTIGLDHDFFFAVIAGFGVSGWNAWVSSMLYGDNLMLASEDDRHLPPVWYDLILDGMDCSGAQLDGVNLGVTSTENAQFKKASLRGAVFGLVTHSDFREADLTRADFRLSEISACRFEDACLDGIKIRGALYDSHDPPVGLPDDLFACCSPFPHLGDARGTTLAQVSVEAEVSVVAMPC